MSSVPTISVIIEHHSDAVVATARDGQFTVEWRVTPHPDEPFHKAAMRATEGALAKLQARCDAQIDRLRARIEEHTDPTFRN